MTRELTPKQKEVVFKKTGLFVVRACPGSGKTFTVAARLARLLSEWPCTYQGIATISFTNVAWEEIGIYLDKDFQIGVPLRYPHFLGTIDSFINNYIFLPFGHLVMECNARPVLTGPPHDTSEPIGNWLWWVKAECNKNKCKLNDFSYDEHGRLANVVTRSHFNNCHSNHSYCTKLKKVFNQRGYATQSDANYLALKVLKDYPDLDKALAIRFPVFMVDEAQDTSIVQMKILDLLIEHGVREMMLSGDPDQSIYEWRKADPSFFYQKCDLWRDNSVEFIENWRSTQHICNFASKISSLAEPMKAANSKLSEFERLPEIWGYIRDVELPNMLSRFLDKCEKSRVESITVLTRGKDFLNEVIPGSVPKYGVSPWSDNDNLTSGIARSKFLFDRGRFRDAFHFLEREICKCHYGTPLCHSDDLETIHLEVGFANWRAELFELLSSLPKTDCTLSDWIMEANAQIQRRRFIADFIKNRIMSIKRDSHICKYSQLTFEELFTTPEDHRGDAGCSSGTVHSVKGKTFDGVLLILKKKDANGRNYTNLMNYKIQEHEELRVLYVAMTRPRKFLVLLVPNDNLANWEHKFLGDAD